MEIAQMLATLEQRGMTQEGIAKEIGESQPSISRWSKGPSEPRYSVGKRIERLYHSAFLSKSVSPDTCNSNMN